MTKPFLKWAGGKAKLTPLIRQQLPHAKRLIEPFTGSAAVSLALEFDEYVLNDSNADLMNVYQILQVEQQDFVDYAQSFFTPEHNQETRFYDLREKFNHTDNHHEKAALLIYLNHHAFNGLCRYNSKGGFNVPFGRYKSPYFPADEMHGFVQKSNRMMLMCGDFQAAFERVNADDVIYCDPPPELRTWFENNLHRFPERTVQTPIGNGQRYTTVGRLVPIRTVLQECHNLIREFNI